MQKKADQKGEIGSTILTVILVVVSTAAWFTHLYVCFKHEKWGFLVAGAIFFPVAIIHGIGVWLGVW